MRDITFECQEGEALGLAGRNGCGKSTLLKLAANVTQPTFGKVSCVKPVAPMLEVGAGFHHDLTGRDNVHLNGSFLGLGRRVSPALLDEIVAFAEIEQHIDTPVKHYSSGMYARLAFAVAVHSPARLLLVDEVLQVGDALFRQKCIDRMKHLREQGATVLLVSHESGSLRSFCNRVLVIDEGRAIAEGAPEEALQVYEQKLRGLGTGTSMRDVNILSLDLYDSAESRPELPRRRLSAGPRGVGRGTRHRPLLGYRSYSPRGWRLLRALRVARSAGRGRSLCRSGYRWPEPYYRPLFCGSGDRRRSVFETSGLAGVGDVSGRRGFRCAQGARRRNRGAASLELPLSARNVDISIVIATFDRPVALARCLDSLLTQRIARRFEIVVVDNHPQSGLAAPLHPRYPGVRWLEEPIAGLSRARNRAIAVGTGTVIVTTDDDVVAPPEWLDRLTDGLLSGPADLAVTTGNCVASPATQAAAENIFEAYGGLQHGDLATDFDAAWLASWRIWFPQLWRIGTTANAAFRASLFHDSRALECLKRGSAPDLPRVPGKTCIVSIAYCAPAIGFATSPVPNSPMRTVKTCPAWPGSYAPIEEERQLSSLSC